MIKVAAFLGLILAGNALAVEVDQKIWVRMTGSENNNVKIDFYGKIDSFVHAKKFTSGLIQQIESDKSSNSENVSYYKIKISDAECAQGYGKLSYYDLSDKFMFNADFIKGGGSVGANLGDIVCMVGVGLTKAGRS
ncbi:hypothetical protein [Enterobacter sp.]|uniref:hypothetical protein n=1 Tax=Enterobacter sp. TaxID=42895 RepID=UPI00296E5143|nr:hypothetical protein [Enterobacter sp.]